MIEKMVERLKLVIDDFFKVDAWATNPAIVKWLPGQYQYPHADKELHQGEDAGKPNDFPYYDLASLFYLNDDYEGGKLYFPKQEIEFKPKTGAAYFIPGDLNFFIDKNNKIAVEIEDKKYTSFCVARPKMDGFVTPTGYRDEHFAVVS